MNPRPLHAPPVDAYWRRIGVQERAIIWGDAPITARPPGRRLRRVDVGPRGARAVAALERVGAPVVEGLPKGSSFCSSDAVLAMRISQAEHLLQSFLASHHPWAAPEAEQASKITLQRGGAPGWALLPDGLVVPGGPSLMEGLTHVERLLRAQWPVSAATPRYRRGTQHSYPDYLTTDTSLVLHALMAAASGTAEALAELMATVGAVFDEPQGVCTQMYQRSGPLRKPAAIRSAAGGAIHTWGEMKSCAPRRRHVFGEPSTINIWQLPFVGALKLALSSVPWFFSYGPEDAARKAHLLRHLRWISDDISGFDQSVSHVHQTELYAMYGRLTAPVFGDFKMWEKDLPLMAAPLDPDDAAFQYEKRGVTPSGTLTTAIDGTLINAARVLIAASAAMGLTVADAVASLGSRWAFFCQGDDTLLGYSGRFDRDVYERTSAALGYKTAVQEAAVYLMHHIDPQHGRAVSLASRFFQQTVFNEYGGEDTILELAGLVARGSRCLGNPWFRDVWYACVAGSPVAHEFHVTDYTSAVAALATPRAQERLRAITEAKPRARGTFRALPAAAVSHLVAALMARPQDSADLTFLSQHRATARRDALRLAEWMATPADDRPDAPSMSVELADAVKRLQEGDLLTTDDTLSSHFSERD